MNNIIEEVLKKIIESGYEAYVVGGYVRDLLFGNLSNDIDICTNATIKELLNIFNGKVNDYGSLNLKINDYNIDITTFREESSYENRRPTKINYINDLKKDLERRDFTINTICMDKDGAIIDYLGGEKDLKKKLIRTIREPIKVLEEDYLRILRAIRFATILDFDIETKLEASIMKKSSLVKNLSLYRIKDEISKILLSENYQKGLDLLKKYRIDEFLNLSYKHLVYTKDLCGMWAQIDFSSDFPFTKNEKNTIFKLREILDIGFINSEVIYKYGLYLSLIAGEILGIDVDLIYEINNELPIFKRQDLNITYMQIGEILGIKPSKIVKEVEESLIKEVLNKRVNNTYEELKKYIIFNKERWLKC